MKIKDLKIGEKMPIDFWNYKVNPIVGYYIEPRHNSIQQKFKYGITPIKG
jgi:hypothetical protein